MDLKSQAKQLKDNKLLASILSEREADIIAAWRSAQTVDERERQFVELSALESLREMIESKTANLLKEESE
jgi:hypothetical protein